MTNFYTFQYRKDSHVYFISGIYFFFTLSQTSPGFYVYAEQVFYLFPKRQIFYSSKFKALADDNFRFDENGSKFSEHVENTVGKGEIARYEQFLLLPKCFQRTLTADT